MYSFVNFSEQLTNVPMKGRANQVFHECLITRQYLHKTFDMLLNKD